MVLRRRATTAGGCGLLSLDPPEIALSSHESPRHRDQIAAARLADALGPAPEWAMVLGSGFGSLTDRLEGTRSATHADLGLPQPGVAGHSGQILNGSLDGVPLAIVSGRVHLYEGYAPADVVAYVRALAGWGVRRVVFTNAAGSLRLDWPPGTLMRMVDHIDMSGGGNPLVGPNRDDLGPRFPDLTRAYTPALGARIDALAEQMGIPLRQGVYASMRGPSYETPAEIRMLGILGADVVGMSTVPEVIAAAHAGLEVAAFSVVSNFGCGLTDEVANHADVTRVVAGATAPLAELLIALVTEG